MQYQRRFPVGAELLPQEGAHFRVWAPKRQRVEVVLYREKEMVTPLQAEGSGYFSGQVAQTRAGDVYRFRLDGSGEFPDPASRFQPQGPHGPSQLVDPAGYEWKNKNWRGVKLPGQVMYELHIGTFTPEGTFASAIERLPQLTEVGVTVLEVMPLADFPGRFGWGYDGVNMFAPTRLYGEPDDFRRFVDAAHGLGMGVILDVVYNHVGPDGNYLGEFSSDYVSKRYSNEWGDALNFDGENCDPVREFFATNAAYWIEEYQLDGLRLDATQQIFDQSPQHVLTLINEYARAAAGDRDIILVAENERQEARLVRPLERAGYGLDAMWNDDFHHTARVALTGFDEAYFTDYHGTPQEFISAAKWGFLYQGQRYKWQKARRGHPSLDLRPEQLVTFLENHDQVSNSGHGLRPAALTSAAKFRAMTALWLLSPGTPMLFMGQEFGASTPFLYFADHNSELAPLVAKGRAQFLSQFPSIALPEVQAMLADPADPETFERCKLDWTEYQFNASIVQLHRDLLRLRRKDPAFSAQQKHRLDGAVLSDGALVLRYFVEGDEDRLLVVNLGRCLHFDPAPEPLLAPPEGCFWQIHWSSESVKYGGGGMPALDSDENWRVAANSATVLVPQRRRPQGGTT
jgi:maltooligosyltrehalose trehalohydrolase